LAVVTRIVLLVLLLLSACSKGAEADLQYIKQARSVAAEWALVNSEARQGKLTDTYVASMHQWIRQQLDTASTALTNPQSRYGQDIKALLALPDDAPPDRLSALSDQLKAQEKNLESA
jgi:hypothetical protein